MTTATYTPDAADFNTIITFQFTATDPNTAGPCGDNTYTVDVSIDEPAGVSISTAPVNICQNSTITVSGDFSGSATGASWSENGNGSLTNISTTGSTVTADYNPTVADIGNTVTFTLTTNNPANTCGSVSQTVDFIIDAPATATITNAIGTEICETQTLDLIANIGGGATSGDWTITGGATIGSIGATTNNAGDWTTTFTPSTTAYGTVTAEFEAFTSNTCSSTIEVFTFDVFENPTAVIPANFNTCGDANFDLDATLGGSAIDGQWDVITNGNAANLSASNTTAGVTTATYTPDAADFNTIITFQFTATDPNTGGPCGDNTYTVDVSIDEPAGVSISTASVNICQNSTITVSGDFSGSATGASWSENGNGSLTNISTTGSTVTADYNPTVADIGNTVTFTLTTNNPANTCGSVSQTVDFIIDAPATATITNAIGTEICETQTLDLIANIGGGATSGDWTITGGATIGSIGATTNNAGDWTTTFTPSTTAYGTVTAEFEAFTSNTCSSTIEVFTFDVFENPTAVIPANFSTCGDANFDLDATLGGSATDGQWDVITNGNAANLSASTTTAGVTTATYTPDAADFNTIITFQFTATDPNTGGPCGDNTYIVDVSIDEPAQASLAPTGNAVCETEPIVLGGTINSGASTGQWIIQSGQPDPNAETSGSLSATTNNAGVYEATFTPNGTYQGDVIFEFIAISTSSCSNDTITKTINVRGLPIVTNTSDAFCETTAGGGSVIVDLTSYNNFVTSETGVTIEWYSNSSLGTLVPDETAVSVVNNSIYYAKVILPTTNCFDVAQVDFTVDPQIVLDAGGGVSSSVEICDGDVLDLASIATPPSQSSADDLIWTTDGAGSFDDDTALRPIYDPGSDDYTSGPITLRLTGSNAGLCSDVFDEITLTIKQTPVISAANSISLCSEEFASIPFTVDVTNPILNVNIDDPTLVQGGISIIDGKIEFTSSINTSGTDKIGVITLSATQNGCTTIKSINLTLKDRPVVNSEADEPILCFPSAVSPRTFTHSSGTGTFNWEITNPALIGDATPTTGTGNFPGFDLADNQTGAPIEGYVKYYSVRNGCLSIADSFKITSNPRPVIQNTDVTFCDGENVNIDFIDNVGGTTTFDWSIDNTTIGIAFPSGSTNQSITPSGFTANNPSNSSDNVAIITVIPTQDGANGCTGPTKTITVTVLPNPVMTNSNFDYTVCSNETFDFVPTASIPTADFEWNLISGNTSVVNGLTPSGTGNISLDLVNTSGVNQEVVYEITPKNSSCLATANSEELTIIVRPEIKFDNIRDEYYVCSGQDFDLPINFVNNLTNVEFVWTVSPNSSGATDGVGTTVSGNLSNTISGESDVIQYTLNTRFLDGTCTGDSKVIDVIVNPNAIIDIIPIADICEGDNAIVEAQLLNGASSGVWSGGEGTFTSTSSPTTTYIPDPNEYGLDVTLRFTANDPDGSGVAGPCGTAFDEITFAVNTLPNVAITENLFPNDLYCIRNGLQELTATPSGGVFSGRGVVNNGDGTFDFDPTIATVGGPYTLTYTYTNPNGCVNTDEVIVEVTNGPNSNFDMETDDSNGFFCSNAFIELDPDQTGGTFTGPGIEILGGISYFNAASSEVLNQDTVDITYTVFEDATSCLAETTKTLYRIPEPQITIDYQNLCEIDNAVQIFINPGYDSAQDSLISFQLEYENSPNRIYEEGQIEQFNSAGVKNITIIGTTALGCTFETTTSINVGNIQNVDFSFTNTKTSNPGETPTEFRNQSVLDGADSIISYSWDFGIPGIDTDISSLENPSFNYQTAGSYQVELTIETLLGCTETISKTVAIVPAINTYPYYETFDNNAGGWTTNNTVNDSLSSWTYGSANGAFIGNNDNINPGNFWKTAANGNFGYYENEDSYLEGPSFDLTSLEKPMIAFDMWLDVDDSFRAGATVEYSIDGGSTWNILGAVEDELNWYNTTNISAIGGQNANPLNYAWYFIGEERNWVRVAHTIDEDEITNLASVKFRINFKGTLLNSDPTGMAIDNFYVGERQKLVLIENFTNLNATNYTSNRANVQNLNSTGIANDILPINFHISIPDPDSVNLRNSVQMDARASIYSIEESPKIVIDGERFNTSIFNSEGLTEEFSRKITRRSLLEPTNLVDIIINEEVGESTISFDATLRPNTDTTRNMVSYFFVIEKSTTSNGLNNIVRQILPNINGVELDDLNETVVSTYEWLVEPLYTNTDLAIITVVQDRLSNSVFEIDITNINQFKQSSKITSNSNALENINLNLYPNPSSGIVNLNFNQSLKSELEIFVVDMNGKVILNTKALRGTNHKELNLNGVSSGVYHIITKTLSGNLTRKKVVILD
ncbi:T9SS type A sorting domain-containing protein [Marivirga arenosa]|uniref:T9SS type A sorting domain-containing protein n=1 Tax=Marivirga arenosa TaxID=3059076 RepID=A0AA51N9I0_9BACT|nr:T9SS type A sorting domain-containing protein [Marivirga sp. ABR2-2]WMN06990.1 T9SS type A sorting domain-containing protein [Marivirga sp. ABR2-2]